PGDAEAYLGGLFVESQPTHRALAGRYSMTARTRPPSGVILKRMPGYIGDRPVTGSISRSARSSGAIEIQAPKGQALGRDWIRAAQICVRGSKSDPSRNKSGRRGDRPEPLMKPN
ncbi:hypothetical protein EMGR_002851, partial [Emarellia grisea]